MTTHAHLESRQMVLMRQLTQANAEILSNGIDYMVWQVLGRNIKVPHINDVQLDATVNMLQSAEVALAEVLAEESVRGLRSHSAVAT